MKKVILAVFVLFFVFTAHTYAQQKYGHINSNDILEAMPEYKQLTATIDKKKKDAQTQLEKMYQSYQARQKELNDYGMSMMEAIRQEKMMELDSLQQTIGSYEEKANADIQQLQQKLLKPLNDKYLKIVNAVAQENGYTFIFDVTSGSLAYYPEKTGDITDLVKKKMGIN